MNAFVDGVCETIVLTGREHKQTSKVIHGQPGHFIFENLEKKTPALKDPTFKHFVIA